MIALAQRVNHASVSIKGKIISQIHSGVCILLGIRNDDTEADCDYLINRLASVKIFPDPSGDHFAKNLKTQKQDILIVSQFTLYADLRKGTGPSFTKAMAPDPARKLYQLFCDKFLALGYNVKQGEFGAYMQVALENDGPVTFIFSSDHLKSKPS